MGAGGVGWSGRGSGARAGGLGAPSSGRRGSPARGTGPGSRPRRREGGPAPGQPRTRNVDQRVCFVASADKSIRARRAGGTATFSAALAAPRPAPRRQLPAASSRRGPRVSGWAAVIRLRALAAQGGGGGGGRRRREEAAPRLNLPGLPRPRPPLSRARSARSSPPTPRSLSLALAVESVRLCRPPSVSLHLPVSAAFLCLRSSPGLSLGPPLSCSLRLSFSLWILVLTGLLTPLSSVALTIFALSHFFLTALTPHPFLPLLGRTLCPSLYPFLEGQPRDGA